ncbi:MAG: serine/threonine protein kinase, partial [Planctomycetes bacterium]|nr:serine/threonine protein kinase [Planctomycetota bacterium]
MKPPATSAAQFRLVEQWFDDVSSLDPHAREHWFAARRAEHPELCAEVESLLAQRAGESDFLERSASPAVSEAVHRMLLRDPRVQSTIGSFVVESVIAVGGMGTVYRAHDADRPEQPVALKVIHPGTGSEEIQLRFRRESELLASLDHPRIAKFLANGLTAEGEPFYAMEFIDGERITDACDRARMSFDRRLELFCEVCDAVQHAHDNAIVHRDLKPGNILVDDRGRPHLIDFGIAKILSDKNVDPTTAPYPTRLLTPEYASPEQVRGLPATASSDVYSLGVVLYELLTSRTPYVFASYHPSEILAVVADPVITAPSRRIGTGDEFERAAEARATTIARWRRRLAKDLDDIVLCALRREPDRRYASAAHLAADIRRALRGERILARPDTAWYRLSRYCERHRVVVVAAAALALTLVVGIAGTLHQAWRAEEQAELARRQAATSTEILGLMLELFEGDDLGPRPRMSAREFVNRAATRLANYGHLDPSIQAAVYEALARMYDYVAAPEPAIDLYERAIGLRERSVAAGGEDRRELLQSRSKLGLAKVRSGDPVAGRELLTAARLEASATGDAVLGGDIATSLALLAAGTGEPRRAACERRVGDEQPGDRLLP